MNVLQMGPYPPPHGGVQTNLVAIRKYLLERGIGCPVINLTRFRRQERDDIYYPQTAFGVARLLVQLNYDLIHLHVGGDLSPRHAGVMLLGSSIPRKRIVFTFHSGGYPSSEAGRRAQPASLRGVALRRMDGIIAVNQELVEMFQRFGVAQKRIRLIPPHAVETTGHAALPDSIAAFYKEHDPMLVTVSGLEREYDLPLQIEALGKLRLSFPRIGLAIIGGGSQEAAIRRLIDAKPYRGDLLLSGDLDHEIALEGIRAGTLFLRTTWYDGDSISVREALHLGTPVVTTDNGMRPTGVHLVPKSDLDALCRTVETVLRRPVSPRAVGAAGTENLDAVFRFYTDLLGEKQ
ncbi:MAG TPA: glycosyltransferase family 4 protein [Bryobacteraceae bacterium]|jgi:glycosyltransferase involved in cell wall biosynthesis|nr:glycosyltransferase family 4 protein [Bryobacteraceae bacterium]